MAALLNAYQLALLSVFRYGGTIPLALAEAQERRQRIVSSLEFGLELTGLVLLLTWVHRISRNTWSLGTEGLQYTPGWSVGWFFVPVANLVVPYNVLNELWRANSHTTAGEWRKARVPPVLVLWWAAVVASAVVHYSPLEVASGRNRLVNLFSFAGAYWLSHLWEFFWGRLLVNIVGITTSLLTVIVVERLTGLQKGRHAAVASEIADTELGVPLPAWRRRGAAEEPEAS